VQEYEERLLIELGRGNPLIYRTVIFDNNLRWLPVLYLCFKGFVERDGFEGAFLVVFFSYTSVAEFADRGNQLKEVLRTSHHSAVGFGASVSFQSIGIGLEDNCSVIRVCVCSDVHNRDKIRVRL
jgi:hypothetical protein